MTLQAPDAGDLNEGRLAEELLNHLRSEPGLGSASIVEHPKRLTGGFETLIFSFRLMNVPAELSGPLVVRVFAEPGGVNQARKEAAFQNALSSAGYLAPRVVVPGGERLIGGRAFNVMERVSGHSLMEALFGDIGSAPRIAGLLAQTHADLHAVPRTGVEKALHDAAITLNESTLAGRLRYLQRFVEDTHLSYLEPGVSWMLRNQPVERSERSVCHGDFHPGNVMVDGDRVTGVLDWAGAQLSDPEHDVAVSLVLVAVGAPMLAESVPAAAFEAFAGEYLAAYEKRRPLDPDRLSYYRAYRVLRAFLRGTASRTPGVAQELLPRDNYPWSGDGALHRLADLFQDITGVELPVRVM